MAAFPGKEDEVKAGGSSPQISAFASASKHRRTPSGGTFGSRRSSKVLYPSQDEGVLATRKSLVTDGLVGEVRSQLTESERHEVDEKMLNQFLRATKLDVDAAAKRIKATVAWRLKEQPHLRLCKKCISAPRSHYLHVVGFTKLRQPVIYSCLAMGKDKDVTANREHMLTTFEQAIRAMPPQAEQWIWLCDFHGFGYRDCDPRLAKIFLDISERHYPERLAHFINIDTPSIFPVFWRAIEPWIDPYTRNKVKFLKFDAKKGSKHQLSFREELSKILDADVLDWVVEEMTQNRTKAGVKQKVYPYGEKFLSKPEGAVHAGHDSRGHADWIQAVQQDPEILVPKCCR